MSKPNKPGSQSPPPDQDQRSRALDPTRSILVQAPAGSGKTDLLTRRFLRLLAAVDDPSQIVAITFTNAAAAEMRHRILSELEKAATAATLAPDQDPFAMETLAARALERSRAREWGLPDLPAQLRISTIDSFCRDLAIQQPLVSGFGSDLQISEQPADLYHRAARRTLEMIDGDQRNLTAAIESLLLWRDNSWHELEQQLVSMLEKRDRWMHDFVFTREPDWDALRARLQRPFAQAVENALHHLDSLLNQIPHMREEALHLARFGCAQLNGARYKDLAELTQFPVGPFASPQDLEETKGAFLCLADLTLIQEGRFRSGVDKRMGFPADCKSEKNRHNSLIQTLRTIDGFESALANVRDLPSAHYTEDEWQIIRACFILLREAAGQLQIVFAESGAVDFIEVAQIAQRVLRGPDGLPSEAAFPVADGIHHLLVDEFQDTSRRQHSLIASLAAAWPDRNGRTIFVVGDPMQSIYFFRDADAELFQRVKQYGLEIPDNEPLLFDFVPLAANFRTTPTLVHQLNDVFDEVFHVNDGSNISFSKSSPARAPQPATHATLRLHLNFIPQASVGRSANPESAHLRESAQVAEIDQIVALIRSRQSDIQKAQQARDRCEDAKFRIAILGRAKKSLVPIAAALRKGAIPFRAIELEELKDRPEVQDALALSRALLNPQDRVAWLGVLRAPWCGLTLEALHTLTSADENELLNRPIPDLLSERLHLLDTQSRTAVERVLKATRSASELRSAQPTSTCGTWLQQVWLALGGDACVDSTARANLNLLWSCLDKLRSPDQDLLGSNLDTALKKLTALPDPGASTDCGVQLMTIHKSKGLEFEIVIVPDLQSGRDKTSPKMLSWLERGLAEPDDSGDVTEFLVAPMQSKGTERGYAKRWVDDVYKQREKQEMRRVLYVAATRAREELHLFARPEFKNTAGSLSLSDPRSSILATAWPAFRAEIEHQFEQFKASLAADDVEDQQSLALAAQGDSNLLLFKPAGKATMLRRLSPDFKPVSPNFDPSSQANVPVGLGEPALYARHEGGVLSRALGTAVHLLLEETARLRTTNNWDATRAALAHLRPRITALVRAAGVEPAQAESLASQSLAIALQSTHDAQGQWILSPHPESASEVAWAGVVSGALRNVRVDRVFRAGLEPAGQTDQSWWVIDYKTAHADGLDPAAALPELRALFAPQLQAYAAVLRNLHGAGAPIRAGLYYPRMSLFDWWEIKN